MKKLKATDFFEQKKEELFLSLITEPETLENKIIPQQTNRPGLAFTGYLERFSYDRVQILGETEVSYIQTLKKDILYDRVKQIFAFDIPMIIVSKGLSLPEELEFLGNELNIPIMVSRITTIKLIRKLKKYLDDFYAKSTTLHGNLVSVYGMGMLITGKSGIGKSECALDLVERKHQLVADDIVKIELKDDMLYGTQNQNIGYFMEIRGVGIVNIEKMFGIQAVRSNKRIDVQVELVPWKTDMDYERIGLGNKYTEILDVKMPIIYLPISSGKNISVILEVIAMNQIMKKYGYDAAKAYQDKLKAAIRKR